MTTLDLQPLTAADIGETYRTKLGRGRASLADMLGGHVETESEGAWITTSDHRRFLNFGGYGVFITGARHPTVVGEIERQLHRHPMGSRLFFEPTLARAADALNTVTPDGLDRIHFSCSGTEATEAAIKLARLNGCTRLISMHNGYHGKTMGALSLTARPVFQDPFRPLLPDVEHINYGDSAVLETTLAREPGASCVILEPVQAEGGVVIPPDGYLREVRRLCTKYGALLVMDEIQTGFGRLGTWWGIDREDVTPDILLAGKALGGGVLPVAATITSEKVFSVLDRDPLLHTSTFSGSPIAMAAVCGAISAVRDDDLPGRAAHLGERLLAEITSIADNRLGHLGVAVRGRGLLIGIDISAPGTAGELLINLIHQNVVANLSLNSTRVLRLTPPAVLTDNDVAHFLESLDIAAQLTAQQNQHS